MKEIKLENYPELKEELENLENEDSISFTFDGEIKFVAMPGAIFNELDELAKMFQNESEGPNVKVIAPQGNPELSYDEYEKVKKQIIKALDESFKPNPEKLN